MKRISIALMGISFGVLVVFAIDMLINQGRWMAHSVRTNHPNCGNTCHTAQQMIEYSRNPMIESRQSHLFGEPNVHSILARF